MSLLVPKTAPQAPRPIFAETAGSLAYSSETAGSLASIFSGASAASNSSSSSSGGGCVCVA